MTRNKKGVHKNDALSQKVVCVNESERHSMKPYRIVFIAVISLLIGSGAGQSYAYTFTERGKSP